ncbi:MAG: hypothetical protein L0Z53_20950 [Acidobacteriales bacterium]|nr:hypothetical protein [Terriglobales bacterium]
MQTLFEYRPSGFERITHWITRHKALAMLAILTIVSAALLGSAYARFVTAQTPNPNFDAHVSTPAYVSNHPRVLFDAAHFNFHTAERNYKPFADLIKNDGYEVMTNQRKFTPETMKDVRVLVIANALGAKGVLALLANAAGFSRALHWKFSAFSAEECKVVEDWVIRGGGLLLISDHAPTGNATQALGARFDVDMSNWWVEDWRHSDPDAYGWLVFSRENRLLLSHPVIEGRSSAEQVDRVITFTGQSLEGPPGSIPFLALADTAREYPAQTGPDKDGRSAAGRAQGVAFTHGNGRVVVLGEAAMLSAQIFRGGGRELRLGMDYPSFDNRKLALNIMHWLSGLTN